MPKKAKKPWYQSRSSWEFDEHMRKLQEDMERDFNRMKADLRRAEAQQKASRMPRTSSISTSSSLNQQSLQSALKALNQKGAGMAARSMSSSSYSTGSLQNMYAYQNLLMQNRPRATPTKPMQPPLFLIGHKVTIRTGKSVWTVQRFEDHIDSYGSPIRYYFLQDEGGRQSREVEADLKTFETAAAKKAEVDFDTVVISDEKRQQILQAIEQVNQANLIFTDWGFGETIEKGRGVSMLFYGPPGTGKTLMAQAIANKLGYTLKVISTADIESSAPGEAERNIRKHFQEAKSAKTILLFDECDSLIYNRAGVGPILSAQINELLSQIERFDGITLFTTNRLGTLDEAVNRRLALKLEFSMPSAEERAEIWKRMFPKKAPLDNDVDFMRLAIIEMTGGYIKNAVLRAARAAAMQDLPNKDKKIKMAHLVHALKLEAESMAQFEQAREVEQGKVGRVRQTGGGPVVQRTGGSRSVGNA